MGPDVLRAQLRLPAEALGTSGGGLKRPPKPPDRVYPLAKNQEYACVHDWEDRSA